MTEGADKLTARLTPRTRRALARWALTPLHLAAALAGIVALAYGRWGLCADGLLLSYLLFMAARRLSPPADPDAVPAEEDRDS